MTSTKSRVRHGRSYSTPQTSIISFVTKEESKENDNKRIKSDPNAKTLTRELERVWLKLLRDKKLPQQVVNEVKKVSATFDEYLSKNCNVKEEEIGKRLLFWLSSCLSRSGSPHQIIHELEKLESIGMDPSGFDKFIETITYRLRNHKDFDVKMSSSWQNVMMRLKTLFKPPTCDKCHTQMSRKIPDDEKRFRRIDKKILMNSDKKTEELKNSIRKNRYTNPFQGFNYKRETFNDIRAFCEECNTSLLNHDIYFECSDCGPQGEIRVIIGGKLTKTIPKRKGSSVCLKCVPKLLSSQKRRKSVAIVNQSILEQFKNLKLKSHTSDKNGFTTTKLDDNIVMEEQVDDDLSDID